MEEMKVIRLPEQREPDAGFDVKHGQTMYRVKVFFDHNGQMTAEDRLKRVIKEEIFKEAG